MALTENNIIDAVYGLYEGDNTLWETTSDEYLTARMLANAAINIWETYDNTDWRELWTDLTSAADGTKTTTAGTYSYSCPTNFRRAGSWVRIGGTFYSVISPEKVAARALDDGHWVYFAGSNKTGFSLKINPRLTLVTGAVIEYEYFKSATTFTTTTSTTEMSDPYMIVYYIIYRLLKVDGEDFNEEKEMYLSKLDDMRTQNIGGYIGISDPLEETIETSSGFGV